MKVTFTNKSDIRLGFEIECVVLNTQTAYNYNGYNSYTGTEVWNKFRKAIFDLKSGVIIGDDGSIDCRSFDKAVELRTPPLPPRDALKLLENIFTIVNKYGTTNKSCGFHVNISSAHKTKMKRFNPIPFLSSKLWNEILKKFNRGNNEYCRPIIRSSKISKVAMAKSLIEFSSEKYRCVNLSHFGSGTSKSSRIEIRGFGNKDYSKKFETISEYIKRIERLFKLSYGAFSEMRTPDV